VAAGSLHWALLRYRVYRIEQQLYADNVQSHPALQLMPSPLACDRILIVAPHPDDEVLGFGGYIQQALAVGAHIHIVTITNGDLRGKLPGMDTRKRNLPPSIFIRVGYLRQQESRDAIGQLGLLASADTFLGFPNGPIQEMWQPEHWLPTHPVSNNRTKSTTSPYNNSLTPRTVYCGDALVHDLETVMHRESPTIIFNLDPNEQHADHIGASVFTSFAFAELHAQNDPFTSHCKIYYYLVHRQCWPAPMTYQPDNMLTPPASLYRLFPSQWLTLPITHAQTLLKHRTLEHFVSQGGVDSPVLAALPRRNELFRRIADAHWPNTLTVPLHAVVLDPPADNVGSVLHPDADILQIQLGRDHQRLLVKVIMRGQVTAHTSLTIFLHGGGANPSCRHILSYSWHDHIASCSIGVSPNVTNAPLFASASGQSMLLTAPWPFSDSGATRTQFFQVSATTTIGKDVQNQTMSETIWL